MANMTRLWFLSTIWSADLPDMSLNTDLYDWVNPKVGHPSDAAIEKLMGSAMTDSPWLHDYLAMGGSQNHLWASGLEHLVWMGETLSDTCSLGVGVLDKFGWRATGILSGCGHPIMFYFKQQDMIPKYLNEFPVNCKYCAELLGTEN
jgi:hypothetical protein